MMASAKEGRHSNLKIVDNIGVVTINSPNAKVCRLLIN